MSTCQDDRQETDHRDLDSGRNIQTVAICRSLNHMEVTQAVMLLRMICKYQHIIRRMTGNTTLKIDQDLLDAVCAKRDRYIWIDDIQKDLNAGKERGQFAGMSLADNCLTMMFPYDEQNPERWEAISELMAGMIRKAKTLTFVRMDLDPRAEGESEKFYANRWLRSMGYGGPEYKAFRDTMLANLNGYTMFRNAEARRAHTARYADSRWVKRAKEAEARVEEYLEDTAEWLG